MKTRNVRRRQIRRYLDYLCQIPTGGGRGQTLVTPQIERDYNRQAAAFNRRNREKP